MQKCYEFGNLIDTYEIMPKDGRKSFYGKATVYRYENGEVLKSYDTKVFARYKDGEWLRLWYSWSATTGRHVASFADKNKAEYYEAPLYRWSDSLNMATLED